MSVTSTGRSTCITTKSVIPCVGCGIMFPGRARSDGKQNKFCTTRCKQNYRGILKVCVQCGREFTTYYGYKHCSWYCYLKSNPAKTAHHQCSVCGEEIVRSAALDLRKGANPDRPRFCGNKCHGVALSGSGSPMYRGRRKANRGNTWNKQRRKMKLKYKNCRFCEAEVDGKNSHVDHIVPYQISRNGKCDPNGDRNLWVLCRSCHCKKTMAERVLYEDGVEAFKKSVQQIAGKTEVLEQIEKAFTYCKVTERELVARPS